MSQDFVEHRARLCEVDLVLVDDCWLVWLRGSWEYLGDWAGDRRNVGRADCCPGIERGGRGKG